MPDRGIGITYIPVYIKLQVRSPPSLTEVKLLGIRCVCTFLQLELFRVEIDLFDVGFNKPQEFIEVA
ncbi:hypothetical protein C6300_13310 [Salmonella enterica]|nr:hypothetical protein [Salmonella enterica]EBH8334872.1 hypothetical protein [Salmonella enterica subsp. houtenae serovar Houten]EAP0041381.1 hypothetical protein [Salmonella enterica]EAU0382135.1 hypothetical protein [Salmonella enterica]EBJ0302582.1 hypothetical protein [Salmonella enterica]